MSMISYDHIPIIWTNQHTRISIQYHDHYHYQYQYHHHHIQPSTVAYLARISYALNSRKCDSPPSLKLLQLPVILHIHRKQVTKLFKMETETETKMEKQVMVVGIDESEHSYYALSWALDHFFAPFASNSPFKLVVVHAKPSPSSVVGFAGPGVVAVLPTVDVDLKRIAVRVIEKAKELCISKSVSDAEFEIVDGDARNVMCEAVEKHHATLLVVGSHGYGAIKRAVIGSVSDYCAHHAHCSVMIVKKPKVHKHH